MMLLNVIGLRDKRFPATYQQTATYLAGRSVKEFNIVVESGTIVSRQMPVMLRRVSLPNRSFANADS